MGMKVPSGRAVYREPILRVQKNVNHFTLGPGGHVLYDWLSLHALFIRAFVVPDVSEIKRTTSCLTSLAGCRGIQAPGLLIVDGLSRTAG